MILIYSDEKSPRLEYISKLIFEDILKAEVAITNNLLEFRKSELPKINYSYEKYDDELYMSPNKLLLSKALFYPSFHSARYEGEKYFFETSKDSFLPFDPFAASFFVVTRLEEYLEKPRGKYGRFSATQSILYKYDLLQKPVVNIWAQILAEQIKNKYPEVKFPQREFKFLTTIDVDNAWSYLHKGFIRGCAAFAKGLFNKDSNNIERLRVWFKLEKDPYDTYDYINSKFKGIEKNVIFFFLLGNFRKYDKNVSYRNKHMQKLIKSMDEKYTIGIHPSFASYQKKKSQRVAQELKRIEGILDKKVVKSRQHFLHISFPKTYRRLIKLGIKEDYTMGYADMTGFRAGICTPYYFYDLKKDKATKLRIFPFQVMDVTLTDYLALKPDDAKQTIEKLMNEVKNVGGTFIGLWHNENLNNRGNKKGYKEVFEFMNEMGIRLENE